MAEGRAGGPVSRQAVSKRHGLLALTTGPGRVVHPTAQLHGSTTLPEHLVARWTVASWPASEQADLHDQAPAHLLREGVAAPVIAAVRRWTVALAA